MFSAVLFAFYFTILLFLIYRITQKRIYPFSGWQVIAIFSMKILLGCLYGFIFLKYYNGDDTWNFFNDSLSEYQKLIHKPGVFLTDLLPKTSYGNTPSFREGIHFYLMDLEYWMMIKLLAIFNIFSRGNYYIDVLFFNFVTCWGSFLLFKLLISVLPEKKNAFFVCIFFIPSICFWLSGIRGEGLLFLFIVLLLYYTIKWFEERKIVYLMWIILGFAGFLIFRALFLLIFLPAFLSFIISKNGKYRPIYYYLLTYTFCVFIFFGSMLLFPDKNLATPVIKEQASFFVLHGNTRFGLDTLKPSIGSFIKILPQAIANTFARPFVWEAKGALQWITAIEIIASWIIFGLLFIRPQKKSSELFTDPLLLLFIFYGISQILIIGFIVPFPGAIVRYKIIPELLLLIVLVAMIDWKLNYKNK